MKGADMNNVDTKYDSKSIRMNIIKILSKISRIDYSGILDSVLIREELGIDSLMAIEIIANIELMYNIKIDESLMKDINTVGDFVNLIESIVSGRE